MEKKINLISLAPKVDLEDKQNNTYIEILDDILFNEKNINIKNIGITGAFGSGKSSVIYSYQEKYKKKSNLFINISLASFEKIDLEINIDTNNEKEEKDINNGEIKKNQNVEEQIVYELNKELEFSFLQQLIYSVKGKEIPQSRFSRIKIYKNFSLYLLTFLMSSISILFFSFFNSIKVIKNIFFIFFDKTSYKIHFISFDLMFLFYIFVFICLNIVIFKILNYLINNIKLSKLKIFNNEVEFINSDDTSILNKYIDEIIYFFEKTKIKYVFIEDLDRFKNFNIFVKLREINYILNNYKPFRKKPIRFIYVISDNFFTIENRVKFFDIIIPIIPFLNSKNSNEKLLQILRDNELLNDENKKNPKKISENKILELSKYIDDMRLLLNLVNEFIIYSNLLTKTDIDYDKLFGIIIYKNLYPDDFVKLEKNKGKLGFILNNKRELINICKNELEKKIESKKILYDIYSNDNKQKTEVIILFWHELLGKVNMSDRIFFSLRNNTGHLIITITLDKLINNFNIIDKIYNATNIEFPSFQNSNGISIDKNDSVFQEILNLINDYKLRIEASELMDQEKRDDFEKELQNLKQKLDEINSWTFQEITDNLNDNDYLFYIDKDNNIRKIEDQLINTLLKSGFIDEDYDKYISLQKNI